MAAPTVIEVTAGEVTEVLKREGVSPDERVTVTIAALDGRSGLIRSLLHLVLEIPC